MFLSNDPDFDGFWFLPHTEFAIGQIIFLANTQYAGNNFYRILSRRGIIFTAYSVIGKKQNGEYQPNT
jgi:hypothetical protein